MMRDAIVIVDRIVVLLVEFWSADVEDAKLEEDADGQVNLCPGVQAAHIHFGLPGPLETPKCGHMAGSAGLYLFRRLYFELSSLSTCDPCACN
jgi:hypothetical protein